MVPRPAQFKRTARSIAEKSDMLDKKDFSPAHRAEKSVADSHRTMGMAMDCAHVATDLVRIFL
jgi:hypothetical protein